MSRIGLHLRTVRHMRAGQILSLVAKRVVRIRGGTAPVPAVRPRGMALAAAPIAPGGDQDLVDGVAFLNHHVDFRGGCVDWRCAELPKLWRYNLHYFDYLLWPKVVAGRKQALLDDWIEENPFGSGDAWEPYTVSLRLVNWIKYLIGSDARSGPPPRWLHSLARQAAWLQRNLETHILANHYLKNAKALLFAGTYFDGQAAERWRQRGAAIFAEQLREQFMDCGAHYELSPMYHCICVEDVLDVLNLVRGNPQSFANGFASQLEDVARRGLDFLAGLLLPDGRMPLLNDAAFAIAPEPAALFSYAGRLFGYALPQQFQVAFPDAGYFILGRGTDRMVVDCGPVSPPYQPGHTHCDLLSFELAVDGLRIVVDAGVHDYDDGVERRYCRSTAAHNTVSVDGAEQSELWGVFRVARRAHPIAASLEMGEEGKAVFRGEMVGFPSVEGRIRHRREIVYDPERGWEITDRISGRGAHRLNSYIHLHPELRLRRADEVYAVEDPTGRVVAQIVPFGAEGVEVIEGWYYPEFGVAQQNQGLRLNLHDVLPVSFGYRIDKVAGVVG